MHKSASALLNNSDIPNYFPFYYRNQITGLLDEAENRLEESKKWYEEGLYYSSTSKSFQSLIDSRFVFYSCEYFNSADEEQYILSLIDNVTTTYVEKRKEAKNAEITGMISLQCVGAAQKRISEAESYISGANDSYSDNDYLTAIYKIAFAMERSRSVEWWLNISLYFNDTGEISGKILENVSTEYIEDAQLAIVYSTVILDEIEQTSSYLNSAESLLSSARNDLKNGYPAAALFGSLEALVKANLAIETINADEEERIGKAREGARNSIGIIRKQGVEPVLAVSYYEYAESLVNESSFSNALVYYKYSDIIAGTLGFTNFSVFNSISSRYVGIPEINQRYRLYGLSEYLDYFILIAIIGCAFGLIFGIIIGMNHVNKKRKKFYENWMPRSIKDYYKKFKR